METVIKTFKIRMNKEEKIKVIQAILQGRLKTEDLSQKPFSMLIQDKDGGYSGKNGVHFTKEEFAEFEKQLVEIFQRREACGLPSIILGMIVT